MPPFLRIVGRQLPLLVFTLLVGNCHAQEGKPFKFTTGVYLSHGSGATERGVDLNLRHSSELGNVWLGGYRSPAQEISQLRAGWDKTYSLGPVRTTPSLQWASGGFLGASAALEVGDPWFVGLGLGRTNLRPYANLNFDPNDAWTVSGGYRWADAHVVTLQIVRDNREHPDQQHVHLVYRRRLDDSQRLTLDLLAKRGLVGGEPIRRIGFSVSYDWAQYFVRAAWDPKVNFSPENMLRLSTGWRF